MTVCSFWRDRVMWKRLDERIDDVFAILIWFIVVHLLPQTVMEANIRKLTLLKLTSVVWVDVLEVHDVWPKA